MFAFNTHMAIKKAPGQQRVDHFLLHAQAGLEDALHTLHSILFYLKKDSSLRCCCFLVSRAF